MQRPLQLRPRFSISVKRPGTKDKLDITNIVDSVSLSVDTDRIGVLSFTINRQVSVLSEFMMIGYEIEFYGGFTDNSAYYDKPKGIDAKYNPDGFTYKTDNTEFFKALFKGTVSSLKTSYAEDGTKTMAIDAKDRSWGYTAKARLNHSYPSVDAERKFADVTTLKISDLVKGICNDIGFKVGQIFIEDDFEYTLKNPAVQEHMTDWAFLRELAKDHSCYVTTDIDGNDYLLNFIQSSKARKTAGKIEFVWLDRKDDFGFSDLPQLPTGDTTSELSKLKENQVQLTAIDVTVNMQAVDGGVVQVVTDFSTESGEKKEVLVSYEEDADDLIYYELDQAKVDNMVRTNPDEADRLSKMGPTGIPREQFLEYYTKVRIPKERIKAMDMPMMGIELSGSCIGNLNIQPFQSYAVYGIGKYQTRASGKYKYYVQSLTHSWTPGDFVTEITFKA